MASRVSESSLPSGSSRISRRGSLTSARAPRVAPCRRAGADGCAQIRQPTKASASSTRAYCACGTLLRLADQNNVVAHGAPGKQRQVWNTTMRDGSGWVMAWPSCVMRPCSGAFWPTTSRSSDDLPQPLGRARRRTRRVPASGLRRRVPADGLGRVEGVAHAPAARPGRSRRFCGVGHHTVPFCRQQPVAHCEQQGDHAGAQRHNDTSSVPYMWRRRPSQILQFPARTFPRPSSAVMSTENAAPSPMNRPNKTCGSAAGMVTAAPGTRVMRPDVRSHVVGSSCSRPPRPTR